MSIYNDYNRPVVVYEFDSNTLEKGKSIGSGTFIGWCNDFVSCVIEMKDGTVENIPSYLIKFTDKEES